MSQESVAAAIAQFFLDNLPSQFFKISRDGNLSLDGSRIVSSRIIKQLFEALPDEAKDRFGKEFSVTLIERRDDIFNHKVTKDLKGIVEDEDKRQQEFHAKRKLEAGKTQKFSTEIAVPMKDLRLIMNVRNVEKSFLYDQASDTHYHELDYRFVMSRLRQIFGEGLGEWLAENTIDCHIQYVPHQKRFINAERKFPIFNPWNDAEWKKGWSPDPNAELAPELDQFFNAFLPDKISRLYTLAWLRDATFSRAEPILVFCGTPGTGKNTFVEKIGGALVGVNNVRMASKGFGSSQFHNNVSHCSLFFLDEQGLDKESRETLKAYHNGLAAIERKGVDVGDPEKIHASFVLANNHRQRVKLEYNDRKFFVPEISKEMLTDKMGKEAIEHMVKRLQDIEYVRQFASYLHCNFTDQASIKFPRTQLFKDICINSFPTAFRRFVRACEKQMEITSTEFNKRSKFAIDPVDLEDMIKQYDVAYKERLCDFSYETNGLWIAKSLVCKDPAPVTPIGGATVKRMTNGSGEKIPDENPSEMRI